MTDLETVGSIVATYEKYGWVLRRFLARPELEAQLNERFPERPVKASDIDAAWFSRPPQPGPVSWEVRYLGEPAFALLEHADEKDAAFEDTLEAVEQRLKDAVRAKKQSLTS